MDASAFFAAIDGKTGSPREANTLWMFRNGGVPAFLFRDLQPVTVRRGGHVITYRVTPDYLAVGTDADWARMPMTPGVAQAVADDRGMMMPTRRMVDDIYAAGTKVARLTQATAGATSASLLEHHRRIERARGTTAPPTTLLVGHKKDVVLVPALATATDKVAIYGWHGLDGAAREPVPHTAHSAGYLDYSHGVRLVARAAVLDGRPVDLATLLADPALYPLVAEAPLRVARYAPRPPAPVAPAAPPPRRGGSGTGPGPALVPAPGAPGAGLGLVGGVLVIAGLAWLVTRAAK